MNTRAWFLGLLGVLAIGCQTEIVIQNDVPNATIGNARWVADDGTSYVASDGMLSSGERSEAIAISPDDEDSSGHLHFDLVVGGSKVALVTKETFRAKSGGESTFSIAADTKAGNPLLEE